MLSNDWDSVKECALIKGDTLGVLPHIQSQSQVTSGRHLETSYNFSGILDNHTGEIHQTFDSERNKNYSPLPSDDSCRIAKHCTGTTELKRSGEKPIILREARLTLDLPPLEISVTKLGIASHNCQKLGLKEQSWTSESYGCHSVQRPHPVFKRDRTSIGEKYTGQFISVSALGFAFHDHHTRNSRLLEGRQDIYQDQHRCVSGRKSLSPLSCCRITYLSNNYAEESLPRIQPEIITSGASKSESMWNNNSKNSQKLQVGDEKEYVETSLKDDKINTICNEALDIEGPSIGLSSTNIQNPSDRHTLSDNKEGFVDHLRDNNNTAEVGDDSSNGALGMGRNCANGERNILVAPPPSMSDNTRVDNNTAFHRRPDNSGNYDIRNSGCSTTHPTSVLGQDGPVIDGINKNTMPETSESTSDSNKMPDQNVPTVSVTDTEKNRELKSSGTALSDPSKRPLRPISPSLVEQTNLMLIEKTSPPQHSGHYGNRLTVGDGQSNASGKTLSLDTQGDKPKIFKSKKTQNLVIQLPSGEIFEGKWRLIVLSRPTNTVKFL